MVKVGCNCGGKGSRIATSLNRVQRVTVYQVIDSNNQVVSEFNSLADARAEATTVNGRVKVTSKTV